jgi:hypothetical protein
MSGKVKKERFTFIECSHTGHRTTEVYCTRFEADQMFDQKCKRIDKDPDGHFICYYTPSAGGLINSLIKA